MSLSAIALRDFTMPASAALGSLRRQDNGRNRGTGTETAVGIAEAAPVDTDQAAAGTEADARHVAKGVARARAHGPGLHVQMLASSHIVAEA